MRLIPLLVLGAIASRGTFRDNDNLKMRPEGFEPRRKLVAVTLLPESRASQGRRRASELCAILRGAGANDLLGGKKARKEARNVVQDEPDLAVPAFSSTKGGYPTLVTALKGDTLVVLRFDLPLAESARMKQFVKRVLTRF
jgi:hypothetical protein